MTSPGARFQRAKVYSRAAIQRGLGGGLQDYLPHVDGRVVAGCFSQDLNPQAPNVILPGTGRDIERWARVFAEQGTAVPVFIKQRSNEWYCMGAFRCVRIAEDERTVKDHAERANRADVTMVLFLERDKDA